MFGPSDISFYFSCDASEGIGTFVVNGPAGGVNFGPDRFGRANRSLLLSGGWLTSPQPLSTSILPAGTIDRTVSMWIQCSPTNPNYASFLSYGARDNQQEYTLVIQEGSVLGFLIYRPDRYSPVTQFPVCDNKWHHVAVTNIKNFLYIFVDGSLRLDKSAFRDSWAHYWDLYTVSPSILYLGNCVSNNCAWSGAIDDVRIYQRALLPMEIVQLYKSNSTWTCPPGRYYRLPSSTACSLCARDASPPVNDFTTCTPSSTSGPTDTLLYLSFDADEGLDALTNSTEGIFVDDNFGNPDGALQLINGAEISIFLPPSFPSGKSERSLLLWLRCSAPFVETMIIPADLIWTGLSVSALTGRITKPIDLSSYSNACICDGSWHHFALRYDGTYVSIFVDATFITRRRWVSGSDASYGTTASYNSMKVSLKFNGAVDDVRIYGRSLPTTDISQIFRRNSTWSCPAGSYSLPGSSSCGVCKSESVVSSDVTCPAPVNRGPSDTSMYFSLDKFETYNAFSPRILPGLTWVSDRFGSPNSALHFSDGAFLASPDVLNSSVLPISTSSFSASAWFSCSRKTFSKQGVLFAWGNSKCDERDCADGSTAFGNFFAVKLDPNSNSIGIQYFWEPNRGAGLVYSCPAACFNFYSRVTLCDGYWHHLAFVIKPTMTIEMYLDISFIPVVLGIWGPEPFQVPQSHLILGAQIHGFPGVSFTGALDDFRIYDRDLSPTEISQIFNFNSTWKCPASSYRLPGSPACSLCSSGSIFVDDSSPCSPPSPPFDTSFYHSLSKVEGIGAFTIGMPLGLSWTANRFGISNTALLFSGSAVLTPPGLLNTSLLPAGSPVPFFTVSVWINCRADAMKEEAVLLSWGSGSLTLTVKLKSSGNMIYVGNSAEQRPFKTKICDESWHHVSIVYKNWEGYSSESWWRKLLIYVDGTLESITGPSSGNFLPSIEPPSRLNIGNSGNGNQYSGLISDLRVYSRVLSPNELAQIFRNSDILTCPPGGYRLSGSPSCGLCVNGAMPKSGEQTCSPSIALGPSDTSFYLSFDAKESLGAFSVNNLAGLSWVSDRFGSPNSALFFSGDTLVASPGPLNASVLPSSSLSSFTVSLWLRCDASVMKSKVVLFSWGSFYSKFCIPGFVALFFNPGLNKINYQNYIVCDGYNFGDRHAGDKELEPKTLLCDQKWHFLAFVVDPPVSQGARRTISLFVDGKFEVSDLFLWSGTEIVSPSHLMLGAFVDDEWDRFSYRGAMDDFRIYSRVLSSSEILSLYLPPLAPVPPPLLSDITLFVRVGLPGAMDSSCNITRSCATISAALLISAYNATIRGIALYSSSIAINTPIILPSSLQVGFAFIGVNSQPTTLTFSMSSTTPCTLLSVFGDSVTLSNLVLDGTGARCCENALFIGGVFNYMDNILFRNLNCSRSLLSTTIANPGRVAKNTSMEYPAVRMRNCSFVDSVAPIYVSAWDTPSISLSGITAHHKSSVPAAFLALDSALSLSVQGSRISGFTTGRTTLTSFQSGLVPYCGAVFLVSNTESVFLSNSYFTNVTAFLSGGAVLCIHGTATSVIVNNLHINNASSRDSGGSISIDCRGSKSSKVDIQISNSSFLGSSAFGSGSHGSSVFVANAVRVLLDNVDMTDGFAMSDGGAVALFDIVSVKITRSSFTEIKSGGSGGAIYLKDCADSILNSVIASNNTSKGEGGAISLVCTTKPCSLMMSVASLLNNSATFGGGGFSARSSTQVATLTLSVEKSTFRSNSVTDLLSSGGGILCIGSSGDISISDCSFENNRAIEGGGAYITAFIGTYVTVSVAKSIFAFNSAVVRGGGLMASVTITTIHRNTFTSNTARVKGGGALVALSDLTIDSNVFRNNSVTQFGGGLIVESCVFRGVRTVWSPPVPTIVPIDENWLPLDANGTVFSSNSAGMSGGGVYISSCEAQLSYLILDSNSAGASGGGIFIDSSSISDVVSLGPVIAASNMALQNGGAIAVTRSSSDTSICSWPQHVSAAGIAAWSSRALRILQKTSTNSTQSQRSITAVETLLPMISEQVTVTIPPFKVSRTITSKDFNPFSKCPMPLMTSNTTFFSTVSSQHLSISFPFALYAPGTVSIKNLNPLEGAFFWFDPLSINATINEAISVWPNSGTCFSSTGCSTISGNLPIMSNFSNGHPAVYFSTSTSLSFLTLQRQVSTIESFMFAIVASYDGSVTRRSFGSGCDTFIGSWNGRYGCLYTGNSWIYNDGVCAGPIITNQVYVTVLHCASSRCNLWVNDQLVYSGDVGNRVFPSTWNLNNNCETSSFLVGDVLFKRNVGLNESACISTFLCRKYGLENCSSTSQCLPSTLFMDDSGSRKNLTVEPEWTFTQGKGAVLSSKSKPGRLPLSHVSSNVTVSVVWSWDGSNDGVRILIDSYLGNAYLAQLTSNSTIGFYSQGMFISSGFALEENTQYALTLVAQGTNFTLYVNGIPVLHSQGGFNVSEFPPVFLGGGDSEYSYFSGGVTQIATGILYDARIWLRALSDREVALFNIIRSPRQFIPGTSVILNQIVSTPTLVSYEESLEGCNTTNTTYYPDVFSLTLPSPKEQLPFVCIFAGNVASKGGDVSIEQSSNVKLTNSLSVLSMSTLGGGCASFDAVSSISISNVAFNSSLSGGPSSGIGGIKGSTGGALMIRKPLSLSLDNVSFSKCAASDGGGLWLERVAGPDSVSLAGISFSSNDAWFGGKDVFVSSGVPPICTNCHSSSSSPSSLIDSNSSLFIIGAATGPRSAKALVSPYLTSFGTGSMAVNALVIVGSVPIAAPLLSITLLDAFGSLVSSDNSSICEVSGIRNDTQGIIALGFSDTYTSSSGIVDIFPFSVENGPGMPGLLSIKCTAIGETSRKLPTLFFPLATSIVSVAWKANTISPPQIYILPSTANEAYPPTRSLSVALVDNSGSTISAVSVRCVLSIANVVDSSGRSGGTATLVGNSLQANTDAGIATFSPGVQAPSNATISLSASCTWISGDSVSTVTTLQVRTYALALFWADRGSSSSRCSCGVSISCEGICSSAVTESANLSDTSATFLANGTRWMSVGDGENVTRLHRRVDDLSLTDSADVPAALPSSTDTSTLQALVPSPSIAVLQLYADGRIATVVRQDLTCSLSIASEFTATERARGGLERIVVSPIAALTGSSSAITEDGRVSFDSIGIRGAGFGSAIPLLTSCVWITGEVIVSMPLLARTNRLRARSLVPPPVSILPSNPSTIFPWSPLPELIIESCFEATCTSDLFTPFLSHPITCIASTTSPSGDSPSSNNMLQLLGTVFTQVNTSSGLATFKSLSASGPFGLTFRVTFSCMWVSGDAAVATSPLISFPFVRTAWMTAIDVITEGNGTTEERILSTPPPPYALYNTALLPIGVSLSFTIPNSTHSSSNFSLISEYPENELVCRLGATVNGSPILITGVTERTASSSGTLSFPSIALMPAVPTSVSDPMPSVLISASCTARGNALPPLTDITIVQRLIVAFVQAPPKSTVPASVSQPFPFSPTVSVAILNATGGVLVPESSASCTVTVIAEDFSPSVPLASRQITLLGTVRSPVNFGIAAFPGLSINAPLGSSATLSFACTRNAGGIIFSTTAVVIIEVLQAAWLPPIPSRWQLFNTPILTSAALLQFVPDPMLAWSIALNELSKKAPGVSCSLMLESPSTSGLSIVVSSPGKIGASGLSDANGILSFSLSVTGIAGRSDNLSALCSVAGQYFSTPMIALTIEKVLLVADVPPPTVWLPSFPGAATPFSPIPAILLVRQNGQIPVDAREAACQMSVVSANATVLDPPLSGYKLSTLISTRVDSSGTVVDNETELTYLASTTPILLKNALIQSNAFGLVLDMSISCQRSQGDATAPFLWKLRIVDADVEFNSRPPSSIVSQTAFALQLRLFDRGAGAATLELDNVTMCVVTVTTPDPSILLQNGEARAVRGVVKFLGVSLAARSGFVIQGVIICSLGQLVYPTKLPWTIVMAPCEAGTAPAGGGGYTCAACPSSTYSDGGIGVAACTTCPSQGVSCAGGLLVLLPGFSRTQDGALTLDSKTELRPCWNVRGCWVNLNSTDRNRAANHTHGCQQGYSGPLCGVCSISDNFVQSSGTCIPCGDRSFNLAIIALLPVVIMTLVIWISLYRKVIASTDSQVLLRILLTYIQTMGTLSSVYFARGTEAFRALFGFTTAMGDSPLTLSSVQCELRIPFYARFGITVTLPFTVVILVLITNVSAVALKRRAHHDESTETMEEPLAIKGQGGKRKSRSKIKPSAQEKKQTMMQYWKATFQLIRTDIVHFFVSQAWVAPVIFVLNASYSSLTTTSFNVFNCMPYSVGGVYYLAQDLSVACYNETHNIFRGIAGVLIAFFGAGFPILFAVLLRRNRLELHKPEVFEKLGFLYDGYSIKRGWYAWESVTMVRKAGIVMIGSLIKDEYNQIFASVSLLVLALFLQANFQPYEKRLFNYLEGVALVTVMLTQLISMFFLRSDSQVSQCLGQASTYVINLEGTTCGEVRASSPKNEIITTTSLAFVNIVFLVGIFWLMFRMWLAELKSTSTKTVFLVEELTSVRNRVSSMFSQRTLRQNKNPLSSSSSSSAFLKTRNVVKQKIEEDNAKNDQDRDIFTEVVNPLRDKTASKSLLQTRVPTNTNVITDHHNLDHSLDAPLAEPSHSESEVNEVEILSEGSHTQRSNRTTDVSKVAFSPLPVVSESARESSLDDYQQIPLHLDSMDRNDIPQDWIKHSNDEGNVWYENKLTGITQWEAPQFVADSSLSMRKTAEELPDPYTSLWIHCEDDTGDVWYQNAADASLLEWSLPEGHRGVSFEEFTAMQQQRRGATEIDFTEKS